MCNLSEEVWQSGLEQSHEVEKLASIRNLMKTAMWSARQDMDVLMRSESKQGKYLAVLVSKGSQLLTEKSHSELLRHSGNFVQLGQNSFEHYKARKVAAENARESTVLM